LKVVEMQEINFANKLEELHEFISNCDVFIVDGAEYTLIDVLGVSPKSKFLFERKKLGHKMTLGLFEIYEKAISGAILPKDKTKKRQLAQLLLSYENLRKPQERKIRSWC